MLAYIYFLNIPIVADFNLELKVKFHVACETG